MITMAETESREAAGLELVERAEELLGCGLTVYQVAEKTGLSRDACRIIHDRVTGGWRERYNTLHQSYQELREVRRELAEEVTRLQRELYRATAALRKVERRAGR